MAKKYDFAGWATKNDVRCADGRVIRKNAFAGNDGQTVPLFWNHQHNNPEMVLGHALLKNEDDGVYAYGYFNNSPQAQHVKESIEHGDLLALSIYANQLQQEGSDVLHGVIRELSVVPGGANPEAVIETAMLAHGDLWEDDVLVLVNDDNQILSHSEFEDSEDEEDYEEELEDYEEEDGMGIDSVLETLDDDQARAVSILLNAVTGEEDELSHSDDDFDVEGVLETLDDDQIEAVQTLLDAITEDEDDEDEEEDEEDEEDYEDDDDMSHSADDEEDDDETVGEVLESLDEKQKKAVAVLIDAITNDEDEEDDEEEDEEEDSDMKHNVFDNDEREYGAVLSHSDMQNIFEDWKRCGSLKQAFEDTMGEDFLAHTVYNHDDAGQQTTAQTYGMADIRYLFPDARALGEPDFISRQMDWVKKVMNGTRHTPFSRVKSIHANITMEEARAKGYVKGAKKADEVFALLKRTTTPQTIYKKQKLDRDDIVDITDFDVVRWIKAEMRMMLEEEIARAILIGDGRSTASADKISEDHVRSIWKDADLYTVKKTIAYNADADKAAKALIAECIRARKDYKGSGNLVMFTSANWHTEMTLLEDQMGRPLYDTDEKLRTKLRVSDIVDVEPMENQTDADGNELMAILVDLKDYNIGADKGGATEFFEDFDIDYNQEKYLLETRFSGALVKPYSAIAISMAAADTDTN